MSLVTPDYTKRKDILVDSLLQKDSLQELVHKATQLFDAPIILTTSYYRVLVLDDAGYEVRDAVWEAADTTGYCSSEAVFAFESEGITHDVLTKQSAYILREGIGKLIPRILQKVIVHGKPAAFIGIFQMNRPFDECDLKTTDLLCDILAILLANDPDILLPGMTMHEGILHDLLDGNISSATVLNDRLRAANWTPKTFFQCALITPSHLAEGIDNADYLSFRILSSIPDAHVLHIDEGLLVLLNYKESSAPEDIGKDLRILAEQYNLFVNVSNPFRNLYHLKIFYDSCKTIRNIARKKKRGSRVTYFDDVIFSALTGTLTPEEKLTFPQTAYKTLYAYDSVHNTDLCTTLNTYIEHGCAITEASQALFIHRNTMAKRLDRIREISGINLQSGKQLIHFYLTGRILQNSD